MTAPPFDFVYLSNLVRDRLRCQAKRDRRNSREICCDERIPEANLLFHCGKGYGGHQAFPAGGNSQDELRRRAPARDSVSSIGWLARGPSEVRRRWPPPIKGSRRGFTRRECDVIPFECHLRLSPSRQAIVSSSTRTASSTGITGRASNTKAGQVEHTL